MKNNSRPTYKFNWWRGFEMNKESKFVEICFGIAVLLASMGIGSYLFMTGLAKVIH
jgi:hypothetical protein